MKTTERERERERGRSGDVKKGEAMRGHAPSALTKTPPKLSPEAFRLMECKKYRKFYNNHTIKHLAIKVCFVKVSFVSRC